MQHFLAIDQGTSGTKAIVVDEAGRVVSIAEVAVRPEYLAGGGVEQDPEALFDSVISAGDKPWRRPALACPRWRWPTRARRCSRGTAAPVVR